MSSHSSRPLQQLRNLDRSLSGFHDKLCEVLSGEDYQQCVLNPQRSDAEWLVDYFDKVRRHEALPHLPLKPS